MSGINDFEQSDYAVSRTYLTMGRSDGDQRDGHFNSPHGYVRIYESRAPRWKATSMQMIHAGRSYHRRWQAVWGDKTLARLAREFADDVSMIGDPDA